MISGWKLNSEVRGLSLHGPHTFRQILTNFNSKAFIDYTLLVEFNSHLSMQSLAAQLNPKIRCYIPCFCSVQNQGYQKILKNTHVYVAPVYTQLSAFKTITTIVCCVFIRIYLLLLLLVVLIYLISSCFWVCMLCIVHIREKYRECL